MNGLSEFAVIVYIVVMMTGSGQIEAIHVSHPYESMGQCIQARDRIFNQAAPPGHKVSIKPCIELNTVSLPRCISAEPSPKPPNQRIESDEAYLAGVLP